MEREFIFTNDGSTKQWVEPESTNAGNSGMLWEMMVTWVGVNLDLREWTC